MNWRRGLIRLWALLSLVWIVSVTAYGISDWNYVRGWYEVVPAPKSGTIVPPSDLPDKPKINDPFAKPDATGPWTKYQSKPAPMRHSFPTYLAFALIPPLGSFAVGWGIVWVLAGFRPIKP